ncbi:MAG: restriction endonuclease subunit S [Saprospiraceae bacterium]|nr:restriction endonuclease subunit S [Saprospiraceae bacterium]
MMKWKKKKLNEFCEFSNGLWTGKKPPFQTVGVIRNTNFTKDCQLDDSDIVYLEVEQSQFQKRKLQYGDIILEKSGGGPKQPVGRVVIFDKTEGDFSFSNFTSVIRIKNKNEVDFNFLYRYLFLEYISGATEKMQSHSTGIRNLKFDEYKEREIPLPSLPEQQRIVSILDDAFAAIAKAKANAEQNLKNVKELFECYLQGVFEKKGFRWEEKKLGEVCEIKPPKKEAREKLSENDFVSFLPMEDLGVCDNEIKLKKEKPLKDVAGSYTYFADNDVLLAKITPCFENGKLGVAKNLTNGIGFGSSEYIVFRCPEYIVPEFLFYFLSRESLREEGKKFMSGAVGHKRVSKDWIENYLFTFPKSKEVQQTIVRQLDALRAETQKLEAVYQKKIDDLEELKKSVLQKAFAGELKTEKLETV